MLFANSSFMDRLDHRKSVLCVDDDKAMHVLLESLLANSGDYKSLHAMSGEEALSALREFSVDLIILDINMPEMDGFQILEHLKGNEETENIPIIVLSGLNRANLKVKALERGAEDFIVKPFTGPELIARVKAVLRRSCPEKQSISGDVQGKLQGLGLFELLHIFSFSSKGGKITFPEMDGELRIAPGLILSARQGPWQGKEALLRLFFLETGSFEIHYEEQDGEDIGTIESLLLFVSSTLDELQNQIEEIAPQNSLMHLSANNGEFPEIAKLSGKSPLTLNSLIFSMEGELESNLTVVQKALQNGSLLIGAP
ncbi:MAG: hypothetical protein CSB23_00210 [Deltaproteobacteria bacterium]|nr:MAG: hypothetical protein CSB23_00210 [Deltaproteobacteria bacterium]